MIRCRSLVLAAFARSRRSTGPARPLLRAEASRAKVTDGNITGWMRASVLGINPPAE
jgi:hypothetical protein